MLAEKPEPYRKGPGRNKGLVRRASRIDLRAFVYAAMRWLQIAPTRSSEWYKLPVQLKVYSTNAPPRWLRPTKEIRRLVADSGCPIEVLAIAAHDIIKTLPVDLYGSPFRRKAYFLKAKETGDKAAKARAAGNTPSDASIRAFEHYLAKNYGYLDADDLSLPFHSERLSKRPEKVRGGDFDKLREKRRKAFGKDSRTRWPRPSDQFMIMPRRMCTYWRKHQTYAMACKTIAAAIPEYSKLRRALQDLRDSSTETQHGAVMDAFLLHEGFASDDEGNP
jgi:hypothetical protein